MNISPLLFNETKLERMADVLMWALYGARTKKFKKNDNIMIRYEAAAIPLMEILYRKIIKAGMNPKTIHMPTPQMEIDFYDNCNNKQLNWLEPGTEESYRDMNGSIFLGAPESLLHLKDKNPNKISKRMATLMKPRREILEKREEDGLFGWTLCILPTQELADQAGLSLKEYTYQVERACFLNKKNPIAAWEDAFKNINRIKKWLNRLRVKHFHVESDNINLEVVPGDQRQWVGGSGRNIPSFEVFLSPDWHGTKGIYYANQPSYKSGNLVEGIRLEFKNGLLVNSEVEKGEEYFQAQLAQSGADKIGEFSMTDKRFSKITKFMAHTLYDENFGGPQGNCHIAIGNSYSQSFKGDPKNLTEELKDELGFNSSDLHWDLVNSEKKRVTAHLTSGKKLVIYEDGMFKY